jgi:phage terminase large subunit-like protein
MTTWTPGDDSPDRMDALVWAGTDLWVAGRPQHDIAPVEMRQASTWRSS